MTYEEFKNQLTSEFPNDKVLTLCLTTLEKLGPDFLNRLFWIPYTEKFAYNKIGGYGDLIFNCIRSFLRMHLTDDNQLKSKVILGFVFKDIGKIVCFNEEGRYQDGIFEVYSIRDWSLKVWLSLSPKLELKNPDSISYIILHDKSDDYTLRWESKVISSMVQMFCKLG